MVMEYLDGTTLRDLIASAASLSLITKLDYVIQVCHALQYAHDVGVVHLDVKPGKIMVVEGGQRVKLLDSGIALVEPLVSRSVTEIAVGTLYYMSPQQMKAERDLDGRADIFAAGVVLFELLTGTVPWSGDSDYEVMIKIIKDPFPPLSNYLRPYPPGLDRILDRALAKDTDSRYGTADQMATELAELQAPLKGA